MWMWIKEKLKEIKKIGLAFYWSVIIFFVITISVFFWFSWLKMIVFFCLLFLANFFKKVETVIDRKEPGSDDIASKLFLLVITCIVVALAFLGYVLRDVNAGIAQYLGMEDSFWFAPF